MNSKSNARDFRMVSTRHNEVKNTNELNTSLEKTLIINCRKIITHKILPLKDEAVVTG